VGPSAQGEQIVTFFHSAFSGREMNGWDNQIEDRLGIQAAWQRRWRNLSDLGGGWQLDVSPAIGVEAGTVSVAADAGVTLRLGAGLENDFGAPRAGPLGGSLARTSGDSWSGYLFASANGRYQPYDVFLDEPGGSDGDPIRGGQAISRDDLRGELSLGAVLAYGGARLTLAVTEETKRYDQQSEPQRYGEVTLGWSF
ncbi:MAG: lipid A deacylase LpxR family protein, partial [Hyphomonadaceae bacterium]|nr:lipid A deacylase LpxR family protein [Hyphomonadaceae bacterium]